MIVELRNFNTKARQGNRICIYSIFYVLGIVAGFTHALTLFQTPPNLRKQMLISPYDTRGN